MIGLPRQLSKAARIARRDGLATLMSTAFRYVTGPVVSCWNQDHRWQGRIVELTGNRARVDGISISLDNPYISTELKSRFLKGRYELPERQLFHRYFPDDVPIIELGACIGVLSCITNRYLSSPERHVVVEANPHLLVALEQNRQTNRCHFRIVNRAVAYGSDQATFYLHEKFVGGSVQRKTDLPITVPACSLQTLAEDEGFEWFNLICDIEGGEVELVKQEMAYLREHVCLFLVEMHGFIGKNQTKRTDARIRANGFELIERIQNSYCYRNMMR